jgi:serine/threonine-protein kinase
MSMMRFVWGMVKVGLFLAILVVVAGLAAFLTFQFATTTSSVEVPDLTGLNQTAATRKLDDAGLRIRFEEDDRNVFDEHIPRGHVVKQEPGAGSKLKQDRRVRVVLSLGPRNLYVPKVVGETVTAAQIKLQEAGITLGVVVYAPSALVAENLVIDQEPRELPPGGEARVSLLVSSGSPPRTFVMADLIGKPVLRARALLERHSFRVRVESEVYEGVPEGTVVRQKPVNGYPVREGDTVWLWVNRGAEAGSSRP